MKGKRDWEQMGREGRELGGGRERNEKWKVYGMGWEKRKRKKKRMRILKSNEKE